jgi:cysteine desulfurase/selenocysteine lyase
MLPVAAQIKSRFPVFSAAGGERLHYLDNAATTQTPEPVLRAMDDYVRAGQGPVHRGLYALGERASAVYEDARAEIARFIGASLPGELVFTRSATESINLVAEGWLRQRLAPGDQVWVTRQEHHSNFLPWQRVCADCGAELCIIELRADGSLDLEGSPGLLGSRTRLIALTLISNVLGIANPVQQLCAAARERSIPVLVDAAQAVALGQLDVATLDCDFSAFSAHKMYGPDGIGALYARRTRMAEIQPLLVGGGMVDSLTESGPRWSPPPAGLEAGSPNVTAAVGFAAAARWLAGMDLGAARSRLDELARYAWHALQELPTMRRYSPPGSHILAFNLGAIHPHDVAQVAAEQGVAVRAGHHCCQPLLQFLDVPATVRLSLALYNDERDIDALVAALEEARALFGDA